MWSQDTLKKGWQSQHQHKNWSQHQTRNPGSLHPKSQFHPTPHVARDAITCSTTGAWTSQTGDVFCRGEVTAGTASDLLCTASMAKDSRGWRGHRERRLGRSSRQRHWQTHSTAWCCPKFNQGTLTQGMDTISGRKSLQDQDKQGLAAPHTTWLPREAAAPVSWRCYREGQAGTSHCRAWC